MTERSEVPPPASILDRIRRQRLASIVPVEQPLLYCSQVQRSGGTLLTRLFDGHPACLVHPNELRLGRPDSWPTACHLQTAAAAFELLRERWPRRLSVNGYAKVAGRPQPGQGGTLPFLFDEDLQRQIFAQAFERAPNTQRDVLNAYLTSLFNAWLDYQNLYVRPKRWVVAFEPRFLPRRDGGVERFFSDYPDGLLVTIIREPSAWLASYRKHIPSHDTAKALRIWGDSLDAGLRAAASHQGRVEVLLFHDLVHRTEVVMRRLCQRMGIAFETTMLTPTYNSMPVPSDSSHVTSLGIDPLVTERHRMAATDVPESAPGLADACERYEEVAPRFGIG
jgi:hypothetical protein